MKSMSRVFSTTTNRVFNQISTLPLTNSIETSNSLYKTKLHLAKELLIKKASKSSYSNKLIKQIDNLYLPLFEYLYNIVINKKKQGNESKRYLSYIHLSYIYIDNINIYKHVYIMLFSTVFIGVSAPQGCGKTTLTEYLQVNIYIYYCAASLLP